MPLKVMSCWKNEYAMIDVLPNIHQAIGGYVK